MTIHLKSPAFVQPSGKKTSLIPIGLYDGLSFEKTGKRQIALIREKGFRFPTNHQNKVYKIAAELHRLVPGRIGVRITIQKNSPPEKGLGSWASASAGAMVALNKLWELGLSEKRLLEIAKKADPTIEKILKFHCAGFKYPSSAQRCVVAIPKRINIKRNWIQTVASRQKFNAEAVVEGHFPDLITIKEGLAKAGWDSVSMSGQGPAMVGFSEKRIGISKIPKSVRSKLEFIWIVRACNGQFKLLD